VGANLTEARRLIAMAAQAGAKLVVLPENFAIMGMKEQDKVKIREPDGRGPIQDFLAEQAARNRLWLVGGTIPLAAEAPDKVRAACLVYDARGERVARYDKIHLFDVELVSSNERYAESETIEHGEQAVVIDTPVGRLGLAICYDLRFPELFRKLQQDGAQIFTLPSAFTAITGRAHWEPMLRSRAIENLSYLIASAQGGYHLNGRETHGHSMIVDPWGAVLDVLPSGSGVVIAEIDLGAVSRTRRHFPALSHRRL
jgi:nitrilase